MAPFIEPYTAEDCEPSPLNCSRKPLNRHFSNWVKSGGSVQRSNPDQRLVLVQILHLLLELLLQVFHLSLQLRHVDVANDYSCLIGEGIRIDFADGLTDLLGKKLRVELLYLRIKLCELGVDLRPKDLDVDVGPDELTLMLRIAGLQAQGLLLVIPDNRDLHLLAAICMERLEPGIQRRHGFAVDLGDDVSGLKARRGSRAVLGHALHQQPLTIPDAEVVSQLRTERVDLDAHRRRSQAKGA